jgi:hypothetical protein
MHMTTTPYASNILKVYRQATDDQVRRGIDWYSDAHAFARALDPGNVRRAAGVIAALSPRIKWRQNLILAARVYSEGHASGCLGQSARSADAIYAGTDFAYVLNGPKVRAFAETIADPAHATGVVVDRHALGVAVGRVVTDRDVASLLGTPKRYERVADAYREAASVLGIAPSVCQAVAWLVWRESMSRTAAEFRREARKGNVPL